MNNYPENISNSEWRDKLDPIEVSAAECEDFCEHRAYASTWVSALDKSFCDDCLVLHFQDELEAILNRSLTYNMTFIPWCDDDDNFSHFRFIGSRGELMDITLAEIERVQKDFKAINDNQEAEENGKN